MVEFHRLFACEYEEMNRIASKIKVLPDSVLSSMLLRSEMHDLQKYMMVNDTFSRTFIVVGILQQYLRDTNKILMIGKTALQLTAVLNDAIIDNVNKLHPPLPVHDLFAAGLCLYKPCSDVDICCVLPTYATPSLKKTFVSTFLLFFNIKLLKKTP